MLTGVIKQITTAIILLILLSLLTGFIYPMAVTGVAHLLFPWRANGSLIEQQGKTIGSLLIGQTFSNTRYFWGRPSATLPYPYNATNSSGSNLGPSNPDFIKIVKLRIAALHKADPSNRQAIPVDLVTASGSGLDPDISPLTAFYQVARVAKARHLSEQIVATCVKRSIMYRSLGFLGEPHVNVLSLNLALDQLSANRDKS